MNIAIASPAFGETGGISRYAWALAVHLRNRAHVVRCFGMTFEGGVGMADRDSVLRVPPWPHSASMYFFNRRVAKLITDSTFDIFHTQGDVARAMVTTAHSCHKAGMARRRLVGEHTGGPMNFHIADSLRLQIERSLYGGRRYAKIIAVSQGVKEELMEYYAVPGSDCVVVPNGVDLRTFHPALRATRGSTLRKQLGIPDQAHVLIIVANEFYRKGLGVLLDAVTLLHGVDLYVLVVGDDDPGPYRRRAGATVSERNVIFAGKVREAGPWYAAADIFVMPTYYEAFSLATLEAAASGIPLLVTRVQWNGRPRGGRRERDVCGARCRRCRRQDSEAA